MSKLYVKNKSLYGIGKNDADYSVNYIDENGKRTRCQLYTQWKNMLTRCYSESYQKRNPTYKGCVVDERWHSFMSFREWMLGQEWDGKALDKDILVEGNKTYGPDTCVLIDRETNSFFAGSKVRHTPRGLHYRNNGTWQVKSNYGEYLCHGTFKTKEEAMSVYSKIRYQQAVILSNKQTDQRVIDILRTRFSPKS